MTGIDSILKFLLNMNIKLKHHFVDNRMAFNNMNIRFLHTNDLSAWRSSYFCSRQNQLRCCTLLQELEHDDTFEVLANTTELNRIAGVSQVTVGRERSDLLDVGLSQKSGRVAEPRCRPAANESHSWRSSGDSRANPPPPTTNNINRPPTDETGVRESGGGGNSERCYVEYVLLADWRLQSTSHLIT